MTTITEGKLIKFVKNKTETPFSPTLPDQATTMSKAEQTLSKYSVILRKAEQNLAILSNRSVDSLD